MSITQGGLVTLGSHGQNNNNANLEVQATGSNIALRVFPFTAVFNRSVSITGPMGRPGLQFNETGNVFDMRCHTNGFEFNKGGSGIGIGIRMLWDNFNGVAMEVGNSYTSLIANYKLFVETGIRAALMSTDKLGVGTTNPSTSVDVNDNTANSEAVKVISNNKPRIMTISDNSAISESRHQYGIANSKNNEQQFICGIFVGTKEVLRLQTDQVDNQTNATSLNDSGAFRSSKSGTYTAVNADENADTSYGVKSESGDHSPVLIYHMQAILEDMENAYGIYAEGIDVMLPAIPGQHI
ncbi:MAG: hypothetical protein IPN26_07115 [Bacteroidetes bacterium]|nr:hypothetical protein [Bacteroidota bacterium]